MNDYKGSSKSHSGMVIAEVKKVSKFASELQSVITQNDGLNKYRFDNAIEEKRKSVEAIKLKYITLCEEFDALSLELDSAKNRLNKILSDHQNAVENNQFLMKTKQSVKEKVDASDDQSQLAKDTRLKLKLCKNITGVYFDFNASNKDVTGFVAIQGGKYHYSGLVPFTFTKSDPDISIRLWEKIGKALHDTIDF